ncbi:MAG: single-stranded DNA-binding protein [Bacteroidota bacterium]|nr:single-stranded DNA-binding protein [Bacteroidota bacterium]
MNNLRNKVQLIGNLGADPEIKELKEGKKIARFSLATTDHYKDKDGNKKSNTEWHTVVAWNKTAEIVEKYLSKGKEVLIDGKLTYRSWEDKDGNKKYITEIVVNELMMLGKKS